MIRFKCPNCQTEYEGDDDWIGSKVACETCAARFYIPEEGHEARLAPPKNMKTEAENESAESPIANARQEEIPSSHPQKQMGKKKEICIVIGLILLIIGGLVLPSILSQSNITVFRDSRRGYAEEKTQESLPVILPEPSESIRLPPEPVGLIALPSKPEVPQSPEPPPQSDPVGQPAQQNLKQGMFHYEKEEYEKAFPFFMMAANKGNAEAQFWVGVCYQLGEGVEQDFRKAFEWLLKAAQLGKARAQLMVGVMYHVGNNVEQSNEKAFEWYMKAAQQGEAGAQFSVGSMYYDGNGTKRDYSKAKEWLSKAAEQGNEKAQDILGKLKSPLSAEAIKKVEKFNEEFLRIENMEFDKPVPSEFLRKYAPLEPHRVEGRMFTAFLYDVKNGYVVQLITRIKVSGKASDFKVVCQLFETMEAGYPAIVAYYDSMKTGEFVKATPHRSRSTTSNGVKSVIIGKHYMGIVEVFSNEDGCFITSGISRKSTDNELEINSYSAEQRS